MDCSALKGTVYHSVRDALAIYQRAEAKWRVELEVSADKYLRGRWRTMPFVNHTVRRVVTTHKAEDKDDTHVRALDEQVSLPAFLDGAANRTQVFTHLVPAISSHWIDSKGIDQANALTVHVTLQDGASSCIMDMIAGANVGMHRTESVDQGTIFYGSVWLITPNGDTEDLLLLKAGDVFVQLGTAHAWVAGPEGVRFFTIMVHAKPVEINGKALGEFW